jgi:hypothetical protein
MRIMQIEFKSFYQGVGHYRIWPQGADPFRVATHDGGLVTGTNNPDVVTALQARHDEERAKTVARYPEFVHLMSPRVVYYLAPVE